MKTSNQKCRAFVQNCEPFKGNNLFGEQVRENVYAVYSYGYHFPLFACINGTWYANADRYSVSTSKQRGQSHPHTETIDLKTDALIDLINR